jgi:hypothetical protein
LRFLSVNATPAILWCLAGVAELIDGLDEAGSESRLRGTVF